MNYIYTYKNIHTYMNVHNIQEKLLGSKIIFKSISIVKVKSKKKIIKLNQKLTYNKFYTKS